MCNFSFGASAVPRLNWNFFGLFPRATKDATLFCIGTLFDQRLIPKRNLRMMCFLRRINVPRKETLAQHKHKFSSLTICVERLQSVVDESDRGFTRSRSAILNKKTVKCHSDGLWIRIG